MNFMEYQEESRKTAQYPRNLGLPYAALGLNGESGEVAEKVKKLIRDRGFTGGILPADVRADIIRELGDVLWYLSAMCEEVGTTLEEVAKVNIVKLASRQNRNAIKGSGDNR